MGPNLTQPIILNATLNATLIQPSQSPLKDWLPLMVAIFAGIITLATNYYLQKHSFNEQNKTNLMNQRIAAYSDLLGHISNFESANELDMIKYIANMGLYLTRAAVYGSPEIKALIVPEIRKPKIRVNEEFNNSIESIKMVIIKEIAEEKTKAKTLWQFWK